MTETERKSQQPQGQRVRRRNNRLLAALFAVPVAMVGAAYASVPLYDLFCRVTGFGGTTQRAEAGAAQVLEREIRVRFVGNVNDGLPWAFGPDQREEVVQVGAPSTISYSARNRAEGPTSGNAVYNVTPAKAGLYFVKVQCFCFDEQTLQPGEDVEMPVYFYVDPAIADDPNLDDVTTITLSYTFYPSHSDALRSAQEDYYRSVEQGNAGPGGASDHDVAGARTGATAEMTAR